ncbi:Uncharacterised protein [Cronobacter universalis NCTC 9529]|uniref:Uncharacterized protein n=1 Tax=Cronobacter universalis NCTC 9529 TaxID=1074000 RepID=A0ABY1VX84_9ENTR|nr:Uncharacterised protein [Cronobacter universalis NCTC 9529]
MEDVSRATVEPCEPGRAQATNADPLGCRAARSDLSDMQEAAS